jgi:1-acyl-sn-glycerol-3-phosphate acyltransferase
MLERAYEEVAKALADGELVGIFPEGSITKTGEIMPFKGGVSRILARTPVPVVPMAVRGLWHSFLSRKDGPAMSRLERCRIFRRIGLAVGEPLAPATVTPPLLRGRIMVLRGDMK